MSKPTQSSVRRHFIWQFSRLAGGSVSGVSWKAVQQSTRVSSETVHTECGEPSMIVPSAIGAQPRLS